MLIPPFAGVGLKAYNKAGEDITSQLFAPNGFMKVDADYTPRPYLEWSAKDWPKTYQSPAYRQYLRGRHRVRAAAPDQQADAEREWHADQPDRAKNRHAIGRHGESGRDEHPRHAQRRRQTDPYRIDGGNGRGLRCFDRLGIFFNGTAATMTVFPVVPDLREISGITAATST